MRRKKPLEDQHWTRSYPRRAEEVVDGGSLYWVIRGRICVCAIAFWRLDEVEDDDGKQFCAIVYDPTVIVTEIRPRRAFQELALSGGGGSRPGSAHQRAALAHAIAEEELPSDLRAELRVLGLLWTGQGRCWFCAAKGLVFRPFCAFPRKRNFCACKVQNRLACSFAHRTWGRLVRRVRFEPVARKAAGEILVEQVGG